VPFVTNIVARSIVPGAPPDLCDEAQRLSGSVRARVFGESAPLPLVLGSSEEPCPACREQIPLRDLNNAVCSRGHAWGERTFFPTSWLLTVTWWRCRCPPLVLCFTYAVVDVRWLVSALFCHVVHPVDPDGADVHRLQSEGVLALA
jgi:hypothetical protein